MTRLMPDLSISPDTVPMQDPWESLQQEAVALDADLIRRIQELQGNTELNYSFGNSEISSQTTKKKAAKKTPLEMTIKIEEVASGGRTYFYVRVYRNGELYDEQYTRGSMDDAIELFNSMKASYMRSITRDMGASIDIRGQRIAITNRRLERRVDRRSRRPEDDVVSEDGLKMDISVDDDAEEEAPTLAADNLEFVARPRRRTPVFGFGIAS